MDKCPLLYFIFKSCTELFKQGFFTPITFGQYKILNTVFYNEINSDISNNKLDYDPKYCTQLIAPPKYNDSSKNDPIFWYADFEADVSGNIHKPYQFLYSIDFPILYKN